MGALDQTATRGNDEKEMHVFQSLNVDEEAARSVPVSGARPAPSPKSSVKDRSTPRKGAEMDDMSASNSAGRDDGRRTNRNTERLYTNVMLKAQVKSQSQAEATNAVSRFVRSSRFDQFSAFLVLSNAVLIGMQVNYSFDDNEPDWIRLVDYLYVLVFVVELLLRAYAFGILGFFWASEDASWNWFDFAIVSLSTLDALATFANYQETVLKNISILRTLRVLRITRVLRIIRVVKFFKELRVMILAIGSTLKVACWALVLLLLAIYIFGTSIAYLVAEFIILNSGRVDEELLLRFGSLQLSLLSLFMSVAGGFDWDMAYQPLANIGWPPVIVFITYILFASFCVMNVIIGIFCQNASEAFEQDRDKVIEAQLNTKKKYVEILIEMFEQFDKDHNWQISAEEFEDGLEDPRMQAVLRTLDIERRDAYDLFDMLDSDASGDVSIDEFVSGCIKFRGGAKAVQVEKIAKDGRMLARKVAHMEKLMAKVHRQNQRLIGATTATSSEPVSGNLRLSDTSVGTNDVPSVLARL